MYIVRHRPLCRLQIVVVAVLRRLHHRLHLRHLHISFATPIFSSHFSTSSWPPAFSCHRCPWLRRPRHAHCRANGPWNNALTTASSKWMKITPMLLRSKKSCFCLFVNWLILFLFLILFYFCSFLSKQIPRLLVDRIRECLKLVCLLFVFCLSIDCFW